MRVLFIQLVAPLIILPAPAMFPSASISASIIYYVGNSNTSIFLINFYNKYTTRNFIRYFAPSTTQLSGSSVIKYGFSLLQSVRHSDT